MTQRLAEMDLTYAAHLPVSERVLDKLADILFATDEILDILRTADHNRDDRTLEVESEVRGVYDRVNELMKTLCD